MSQFFANTNRARLRIIKEDDNGWGVTPTSGTSRELRYTGSTINANKTTVASEEIRADRMVADHIETSANTAGDINIEFSAGTHDDILEAFCFGAWTRPMTFDSVKGIGLEWTAGGVLYVKGTDVTDYFFAGRRVRTQGFVKNVNNDYFQISTIVWNAGANRTEITMSAATAVAEKGSAVSAMFDANDVIVLKNTTIRAGTAGDASFDSNGNNAFAAAIAAGQLASGQKVFVEGLGFESGTVTVASQPATGAQIVINDGSKTLAFQFGGLTAPGVIPVALGTDVGATAENLSDAITAERVAGGISVSASANETTGVVTIKNLNVTGGNLSKVADTGAALTVAQFSGGDATLRGVFTVTSVVDDKMSVSPAPNTFANVGALAVTIKGSMLRNPQDPSQIVPQSFSIETGFEDVNQYFIADGLRVGTISYDIASNAILKGTFAFNGRASTRSPVSKLGAMPYTVLGTTSTPVANATTNVGAILLNGETLTTAVQSITLSGNNNLRDQNAVGYKFPAGIGAGRMEITGNLVAYFADGSMWDKFIEHDTVSVSWSTTDVEGHHYEFTVPAVNFSTDTVNPPAGNQDVMENMAYEAKRDPATGCQIQFDRFSCILPPTA